MKRIVIVILLFALALLLASRPARAEVDLELYLDLGLSAGTGYYDVEKLRDGDTQPDYDDPLGTIELGVRIGRVTIFTSHTSSLRAEDGGIDQFGVRVRALRLLPGDWE